MDNIYYLKGKNITPEAVVSDVLEKIKEGRLTAVYIVGIQEDGMPRTWASGDLGTLCLASKCLDLLSDQYLLGDFEE